MANGAEPNRASRRMARPDDARALRSRDALRAALLKLVEETAFEQITIRMITQEAGVSYPVFFRRYSTKEELLEDIAIEEVGALFFRTHPMFDASQRKHGVAELCAFVNSRRALWKSLLTSGAAPAMRSQFARIAAELGENSPRANPWLPVSLASAFVAAGLFEILAWWLSQPDDYPVSGIVTFIEQLIVQPLALPHPVDMPSSD